MTLRRGLVIGLLFALLASIGSALLLYKETQQQLTLEGNRLYSTQSIKVEGNLVKILEQWNTSQDNFTVYKPLDNAGSVRSVYSTNYSKIAYPIHRGRAFTQNDTNAALVGAKVELVKRDTGAYFVFEGRDYEVVGYLGRHAESLLENDVLLADPGLFAKNGSESLVVDGPDVATLYSNFFSNDPIEPMNQSTNRRTTIDFVSPILLGLGFGIMAVGSVFVGLLAASHFRARNRVSFLMGRTRTYTTLLSVIQLTVPAMVATISIPLVWNLFTDSAQGPLQSAYVFWWQVPLAVLAMLTALATVSRKA